MLRYEQRRRLCFYVCLLLDGMNYSNADETVDGLVFFCNDGTGP